jgi:dTDP-4-amino-4,6-dideoxygalactose transaminase
MIITKTAQNINNSFRRILWYKSARAALLAVLKMFPANTTVLLPAYIGYSDNEGSGIFDPIIESKLDYVFYKIDSKLFIDINDYKNKLALLSGNRTISVFVHYFGYVDPHFDETASLAKEKGSFVIEDCAHALYTDFEDHKCGNIGDACIYSLHKMLPYRDGGMLKLNSTTINSIQGETVPVELLTYDIHKIAAKRKENALFLEQNLEKENGISILRNSAFFSSQTPQTFPVLLDGINRDDFYLAMNRLGFGIVSLYHTMISPLQTEHWPETVHLSKKITNLPVHQDTDVQALALLCKAIHDYLLDSHEK